MDVKIELNEQYKQPEIIIRADKMTAELERVVRFIAETKDQDSFTLIGSLNDGLAILNPSDIFRVYAERGKVFAETENNSYEIKFRLYELEEKLNAKDFIRISKSEIINLKKVEIFKADFTGAMMIVFKNKQTSYVSRRYLKDLKERLGV